MLREIAEATHVCGDPGLQYDTTINRWNPVKNSGRINATNPCSEFIFLDDTACNLASLNLLRFCDDEGRFLVDDFRNAVKTMVLAMEIIVGFADYPTEVIERNSHDFRPLGLGYANLGALLMLNGLPYDSEAGRNVSAAITSLMCGEAYLCSARIARTVGPFLRFEENRAPFLEVIGLHREYALRIPAEGVASDLHEAAREVWGDALDLGRSVGFRNAQATVLAPTGTIAFMMDCDTTGIEPDLALVKYKQLVGGGALKIVNRTVPGALRKLGYTAEQVEKILAFVDEGDTIEGAPTLDEAHLPVFDCAFPPARGSRSISYMGHIRMMAAVQPFLSGGISKTVNLPNECSVEDIMEAYVAGWKLGLKSLAIYRDGSKRTQPLSTAESPGRQEETVPVSPPPRRRKLPDVRQATTHKFSIAGHDGYITVGLYDDGQPGEVFLKMSKEGSTISGLMDTVAILTSMALQYGVPVKALVDKFGHTRFEPSGFTPNPEIPFAKSVIDYVYRWLGLAFLPEEPRPQAESDGLGVEGAAAPRQLESSGRVVPIRGGSRPDPYMGQVDAPPCMCCGALMMRAGACYVCPSCGESGGCG